MKTRLKSLMNAYWVLALATSMCLQACGQAPTAQTPRTNDWSELRSLSFPENYPTEGATEHLYDEMLFPQVVLWSIPAMTL